MMDRPELAWPTSTAPLTNANHTQPQQHSLVPNGGPGYQPSAVSSYSPTVALSTPPPNLLSVSSAPINNSITPNLNLSLSINPRLFGPSHMPHSLTTLINSLHGLNKLPPTSQSDTSSSNIYHQVNDSKNSSTTTDDSTERDLKEKVSINSEKSAFHQVTPALTIEDERSEFKSPTTASTSPSTSPPITATTIMNQTKTVWRPY